MTLFLHDHEFQKLLSHRRDVDLVDAALELARDADPQLDFLPTQEWIEQRAREVGRRTVTCRSDDAVLRCLISHLADELGLRGDTAGFEQPECSYLPNVIDTGRGIPISLSVLYMAIGQRAGIVLEGISAPMHFLSRFQAVEGPIFVDAYAGGRTLTQPDCVHWLQAHTGLTFEQIVPTLRPATPRSIISRMLCNLKVMHCRQGNWRLALRVQQRLTALDPQDVEAQHDLGRLALQADAPGIALDAFQRCLGAPHQPDTERLRGLLRESERRLASLN